MVYTLTLNPALDYRMELSDFSHHQLNRADYTKMRAGGKGINVSQILSILGTQSIALGFVGGFSGKHFEEYIQTKYKIDTDFITINDNTRINVKLKHDGKTTEINAPGPQVSEQEIAKLFDKFTTLNEDDIVVLAGSFVKSDRFSYTDIVKFLTQQGTQFVLDIDTPEFIDLLAYNPLLVKPNEHEVEKLLDKSFTKEQDLINAAKRLVEKGAQNVIISRGGDGAIFANKDHVYVAESLKGDVKNTVGAGDSMVGGFLSAHLNNKSPKASFALSVASGSATAFDYGLAKKEAIYALLNDVTIKEVER